MRMVYSENEPIEKHPPRKLGDLVVVINKQTGFPEIAKVALNGYDQQVLYFTENGYSFNISPYHWEIAWP